ncbi:glyoxalase [Fulvivirga sp. M361]|uniref:VOC family protein n=1 Tax=Fulvivirga sp. M361 TaxID=2594266 RepID=UPI00117B7C4D|nr:VOC family protein [Fulvivirga sp. M361]TRX49320.1 glyoxalase [Fulvivirga sp. M361]
MKNIQPFHLAFPVDNLEAARKFYTEILQCPTGRSSEHWIDFNLFGHQIVAHLAPEEAGKTRTNQVDGDHVPVKHFGVILEWQQWEALAERLESLNIEFIIQPHIRFKGEVGEQATMFFLDPSGNALEFKSFKTMDQIFAH